MKTDRTVRSLTQLERYGSTARVLNLNAIAQRRKRAADGEVRPLFHNVLLDRGIIIKHRLRKTEQDLFLDNRLLATKVVLPIDSKDLASGAHYFFVGQRGHVELINSLLGSQSQFSAHDRTVLQILDESPTLDPFVLRELLRRQGFEPSPHYFDIGLADLNRMQAFVAQQVEPLAATSGVQPTDASLAAAKLARKLMSSKAEVETEPLRNTLRLEPDAYREGVFCWKGFLYYKWSMQELLPRVSEVMREIGQAKMRGVSGRDLRGQIEHDRAKLKKLLTAACASVQASIGVYDTAYSQLVEAGDSAPFRQFLLNAPGLFARLGEGLGAIQHIVSYWRFSFPPASQAGVDPIELCEILEDFLQVLQTFEADPAQDRQDRSGSVLMI